MPITREQFEKSDFKQRAINNEDYLLEFLKKNSNMAYTPVELAESLKRSSSIIRQKLRRLLKAGIVERKVPQYILSKKVLKSIRRQNSKKKSRSKK